MPSIFDVGKVARDVVDSVGGALDRLFTSEKERRKAKRLMEEVRMNLEKKMLQVKQGLIQKRGKAVEAEINSESWLTRSWRPIVMLAFTGAILAHWFAVAGTHLEPEVQEWLYKTVRLGLGGYVIGRSAEKIAPHAKEAYQSRNETKNSSS